MICSTGLDLLQSSGEYPCAVCRTGVGKNRIFCNGYKLWVHKKYSKLQRLTINPSAGGGCEITVTPDVRTAWKKFLELLMETVPTSRQLSYKTSDHVYISCVWSTMLHASETLPLTKTNLQRLQRNDRAMISQICSIKSEDVAPVRSSDLVAKLELEDLELILREVWACGAF